MTWLLKKIDVLNYLLSYTKWNYLPNPVVALETCCKQQITNMSLIWGMSRGQVCECGRQKNATAPLQHLSKSQRLFAICQFHWILVTGLWNLSTWHLYFFLKAIKCFSRHLIHLFCIEPTDLLVWRQEKSACFRQHGNKFILSVWETETQILEFCLRFYLGSRRLCSFWLM